MRPAENPVLQCIDSSFSPATVRNSANYPESFSAIKKQEHDFDPVDDTKRLSGKELVLGIGWTATKQRQTKSREEDGDNRHENSNDGCYLGLCFASGPL